MANKKYWELTQQTGASASDLLTFAKQEGGDFITSYISIEDFLASISEDSNVNLGPVLDNTVSNPSTLTPNDGDRYMVPAGSVNDWLGQDGNIAQWDDSNQDWIYYIPQDLDRTIVTTGVNAGKIYQYDSGNNVWNEVILPITSATPFFLAGTTVDAGSNKTSRISRTGDVLIGATGSSLNAKFVVGGKTIANAYATRTGFASTSDITRTGKWYRIMSFDCNYSIYATHHFKIILGFNGNSNGAGFVAELDLNIKRQNTSIYTSVVVNQSASSTELLYDVNDKNIEFLWNNTTKRVTMYFRPDQNYSALSLTILNPRETANTRFSFLNQYTNATDLSAEVSNSFTEKSVVMGDVIGNYFTAPIFKRKISNEINNDYVNVVQSSQAFGIRTEFGDASYGAKYIFSPQQFSFEISDNANSVTNNVLNNYSSNNYYLSDKSSNVETTYQHNTTNFYHNITDSNNSLVSDFFIGTQDIYLTNEDQLNGNGRWIQLLSADGVIIRNFSNNNEINTNIQLLPDNLQLVCYDVTGGNSEKTTVNQTNKDLTLRFEDTNLGVDNTIEFNKTQLVLPDGYNIYSNLQNANPDIVTLISVGDSNNQGQAIQIVAADIVNGIASAQNIYIDNISSIVGDSGTNEGFIINQNTASYTIQSYDQNFTYLSIEPTSNLLAIRSTGNILMSDLPVYTNDAAADADTNLPSGSLYKLTGSRAVYQKP